MTTAKPVALVTGASSGIGKAAALALVDAGFEVVGTSRNTSGVAPLDEVTFLDLDVTSDESVSTAVGRVIERFGRLDVLVNNAGTGAAGAAEEKLRRPGPARLRYQLLRARPDDEGGPPAHARRGKWSDHQHLLGARTRPRAVHGQLRRDEARDRGLLRVGRPRSSGARDPGASHRARLHQDRLRRQSHPARRTVADLRGAEARLRRRDGACHGGRR